MYSKRIQEERYTTKDPMCLLRFRIISFLAPKELTIALKKYIIYNVYFINENNFSLNVVTYIYPCTK